LVGEYAPAFRLYNTTTRSPSPNTGRITDLMQSGKLWKDLNVSTINPETDRAMICGSMDMLKDIKTLLEGFGLSEGSNNRPDTFVVERAFVD